MSDIHSVETALAMAELNRDALTQVAKEIAEEAERKAAGNFDINNPKENPTGGKNNYYTIDMRLDPSKIEANHNSVTIECKDIINALELNFDQGTILKSLWRDGKKESSSTYNKEKVFFSACEELFKAHEIYKSEDKICLIKNLLGLDNV